MLSHVSWKKVEQDSLVVQLDLLHVVSLLFGLHESRIRPKSGFVVIGNMDTFKIRPLPVIAYLDH